MPKLATHVVVALSLWFGLAALGLGAPWRIAALVVGAVAVHRVWERLFPDPFLYLGAMPVASDDPLMVQAVERAKDSLPDFLRIYPAHSADSTVKFRFTTDKGTVENLWGDLLELDGDQARVYVRTPPIDHAGELDPHQTVPLSALVDWQVEFPDGTLRGGFTNRALFKIFERQEGRMHPQLLPQLQRFKDLAPEDF